MKIKAGRRKVTMDAISEKIKDNMKLVHFILHKEFPGYADDEDMIQACTIALWKAIQNYDPQKGTFCTFACYCIHMQALCEIRVRKKHDRLCCVSLDKPISADENITLADTISADADESMNVITKIASDEILNTLPPLARYVFSGILAGRSQNQIAEDIGCSQSHISRILKNAIERLRKAYT